MSKTFILKWYLNFSKHINKTNKKDGLTNNTLFICYCALLLVNKSTGSCCYIYFCHYAQNDVRLIHTMCGLKWALLVCITVQMVMSVCIFNCTSSSSSSSLVCFHHRNCRYVGFSTYSFFRFFLK